MTKQHANKVTIDEPKHIKTTGLVQEIINGKDGYTAKLVDADGKHYKATISIVNLSHYGSTYKRHQIGETITVEGSCWTSDDGIIRITVEKLNP